MYTHTYNICQLKDISIGFVGMCSGLGESRFFNNWDKSHNDLFQSEVCDGKCLILIPQPQ